MDNASTPDLPTPDEVAAKVEELRALEQLGVKEFADALADNIMEPLPVETAAFRSDALAFLSLTAARYLIDHANEILRQRHRSRHARRGTQHFVNLVGRERRILENIVNGLRAKNGDLPNAPNPRKRAMQRLWNENMAGDVPQGRYKVLFLEEQELAAQRKRDEKKARRDARRAARA